VTEAINLAQENTAKMVEERQVLCEESVNDKTISLGSVVLLKKHEKGRCKIQDNWKPIPYKVVDKLNDNVYCIQLADGSGPIRNVTRTDILDTRTNVEENVHAEDSDSSSEEWSGFIELSQIPNQSVTEKSSTDVCRDKTRKPCDFVSSEDKLSDSLVEVDKEVGQRQSKRVNVGKHSNPYNLPKLVLKQNKVEASEMCSVKFEELGQAMAVLGESLGKALGQNLQDVWMKTIILILGKLYILF